LDDVFCANTAVASTADKQRTANLRIINCTLRVTDLLTDNGESIRDDSCGVDGTGGSELSCTTSQLPPDENTLWNDVPTYLNERMGVDGTNQ